MARPEKEAIVAEVQEKISRSQAVVLADYRGLNVEEINLLRKKLREAGVEYRVIKNTLIRLAAKNAQIDGLDPYLEGPTAIAFGYDDPVAPAKIMSDFAKDHKNLELKAGLLGDKVIDVDGVKALANLPSRTALLAQLAGLLQAPMRGLVTVLSGPMRNAVYALEAIRKKQAGEA
ncbi:MAG TPA: 50S ribosomal protein L10 [Firmicutes bacterium]|nr:50S ribosomal protein L10 [Bacillota bacterium]